jgi:hypothetical protein
MGVHVHQAEAGLPVVRHADHPRIGAVADPKGILEHRYGADRPRRRGLAIVLGTVVALALLAWAIWAGTAQEDPPLEAQLTAYDVVSSHEVRVKVDAHVRDPGTSATCLVRATAEDHTVVGELTLTADQLRRSAGAWIPVRTERRATTAEVVRCTR